MMTPMNRNPSDEYEDEEDEEFAPLVPQSDDDDNDKEQPSTVNGKKNVSKKDKSKNTKMKSLEIENGKPKNGKGRGKGRQQRRPRSRTPGRRPRNDRHRRRHRRGVDCCSAHFFWQCGCLSIITGIILACYTAYIFYSPDINRHYHIHYNHNDNADDQNNGHSNNNNNNNGVCHGKSVETIMTTIESQTEFCDANVLKHNNKDDDDDDCKCANPLEPQDRSEKEMWTSTFERNKQLASQFGNKYDIVFFGDSITEHWQGTEFGMPVDAWQEVNTVFREEFTKIDGGRVNSLALGIAADRCGQLEYRIRNGELPPTLDAKVFWVLIGTNDLRDGCSADAVSAGIIRVVEEIHARRPRAQIVLNSILPVKKKVKHSSKSSNIDDGSSSHHTYIAEPNHWKLAQRINQFMECYGSTKNDDENDNNNNNNYIHFFNATDLFFQEDGVTIEERYFEDVVHPSSAGSSVWARAIVDQVMEYIE